MGAVAPKTNNDQAHVDDGGGDGGGGGVASQSDTHTPHLVVLL
jgi:hypothetical protein